MRIDLILSFIAGFIINIVANLESFYSHVKIKSIYGAIIGFIYLMLTGLIFTDIISSSDSENRFWLIFALALGGGAGNYLIAMMLNKKEKVKKIIAIGESAEKIKSVFSDVCVVQIANTMSDAVSMASSAAITGDVVLLSPACASFDWFENYEHRGEEFKQEVLARQ